MQKKVVIAMSGGVDSSVAAVLLKNKGYECIGMHLKFWSDPLAPLHCGFLPQNKCCASESLEDARSVAAKLKMPFYVVNVADEFKKHVVDYFLKAYECGLTPNPCIECNSHIKFGLLLKKAMEIGSLLATGHYVKIVKKRAGQRELRMAKDKTKDQSYFLYRLTQAKLKHLVFPLGNFMKDEVYEIAGKEGLNKISAKKESQGICFFPEATPGDFLKRHLDRKFFAPGQIISLDGRMLGQHKGLPYYTIGQRQGIGIGGISGEKEKDPWFTVKIDRRRNALIVGKKKDLFKKTFVCEKLNFVSGEKLTGAIPVEVRVRYRAKPVSAMLKTGNRQQAAGSRQQATGNRQQGIVDCKKQLVAVCPGQSAVFYRGECLLGGGIIKS